MRPWRAGSKGGCADGAEGKPQARGGEGADHAAEGIGGVGGQAQQVGCTAVGAVRRSATPRVGIRDPCGYECQGIARQTTQQNLIRANATCP